MQTFGTKQWAIRALSTGAPGVRSWNDYTSILRKQGDFDSVDLSHMELIKINLDEFRFDDAAFEEAVLTGAFMQKTSLKNANFKKANLENARCLQMDAEGADFTQASLKAINAEKAIFTGAKLVNADLSGAILKGANITGADLTGAEITSTMLNEAVFDEKTKFPQGFVPSTAMVWIGKGEDPRRQSKAVHDYQSLIQALLENFDPERVQRALRMLQSEKFQLFTDISDDTICGVARSQSEEDRVYASVLNSDGTYICCTQNLRQCGALREKACKHFFLLIMVLCKTDRMEAKTAYEWLVASGNHKPGKIDKEHVDHKDLMTKIFLRHKGAEEGHIDWRPMETVPEDYYM